LPAEPLPVEPVATVQAEVKTAPVEVPSPVLVPQVAYSYLPYATSYPYYTAIQPQQVSYTFGLPQAVEAPKIIEVPQPVNQVQVAPATYTIESVQPVAIPEVYNIQPTPDAPVEQPAIVSVPILKQYHSQDELGQYNVRSAL